MSDKYKNLKVKELQELLQKNGLPHAGKKEELIERLVKNDEQTAKELATLEEEFGDLSEFDDTKLTEGDHKLVLDDINEPLDEDLETEKKTKEAPVEKIPEPVTKSNSNFTFTPITFDKKPTSLASPEPKKVVEKIEKIAAKPTTAKANDDAEKALERAKRFGISLNETAKKDIRAQRFGISENKKAAAPAKTKGIEPEVLKKRAERFGLGGAKVPVTVDPAEEDKKRKRAERFADASKKQKASE